jgi:hypothetical protein
MPEKQVIRIHMHDRPGALSQICLALASHDVNIVHLDVVSSGDGTVVDDLVLEGKSAGDIARAVKSFLGGVTIASLPSETSEPMIEFGTAIARMGSSPNAISALDEMARGAGRFLRADRALALRLKPGSGRLMSSIAGIPDIAAIEPFAGRALFAPAAVSTFSGECEWAPPAFRAALGAAQVALAPASTLGLIVLARHMNIPFTAGELKRLSLYSSAGGAILSHFEPSLEPPRLSDDRLPSSAVTEPVAVA